MTFSFLLGRVLNRFSKDIGFIDDLLPQVLFEFLQLFVRFLGILITSIAANNYLAIVVFIITVVFVFFRWYYLKTVRDVKRLEAIGTVHDAPENKVHMCKNFRVNKALVLDYCLKFTGPIDLPTKAKLQI